MKLGPGISLTGGAFDLPPAPPSAPVNLSPPVITPSSANTGAVLTCSTGAWSGVPTPTFAFQWKLNGANIDGETSQPITTPSPGAYTCDVVATNSQGTSLPVTSTTATLTGDIPVVATIEVIGPDLRVTVTSPAIYAGVYDITGGVAAAAAGPVEVIPPVVVSNSASPHPTFTATPGFWITDNGPIETVLEFLVGGNVVATGLSYLRQPGQEGSLITYRERAVDLVSEVSGTSVVAQSAFSIPVLQISANSYLNATPAFSADDNIVAYVGRVQRTNIGGPEGFTASGMFMASDQGQSPRLSQGFLLDSGGDFIDWRDPDTHSVFNAGNPNGARFDNPLSYAVVLNTSTGIGEMWINGSLEVSLSFPTPSTAILLSDETLLFASRSSFSPYSIGATGMVIHGGTRVWTGWNVDATTLAGLVFASSGTYDWLPWAADGAVNDNGTMRVPRVHFVANQANWNGGINNGSGANLTVVGTATEITP